VLPEDAPHGLCPACLLQIGLDILDIVADVATNTTTAKTVDLVPGMPPAGGAASAAGWGVEASVPGYELLGELGRGGMGVVYKARHRALDRTVALKMILSGSHAGEGDLARFQTEAGAIARLQHPNIVQIHEVGEHEGKPFFSLEFCGGGSLEKKLHGTPLPAQEAAALVETLARAMQAAHEQHVIHRDLKPANVLLTEHGTPKITDFGLAKKLDEASQTQSGAIMGTPSYMAPEQAGGKSADIGPAADVYALGAILYECLTGRPPFKAATALDTILQVVSDEPVAPSQLQTKMPRDVETICLKCLRKEPQQRYLTADALAADLRRFQADEPIAARPPGRGERAWRWCRRNKAVAAAVGAAVFILVVGIVVSTGLAFWAMANATRAEAREREVRQEKEKTSEALAAEARRLVQTRQALDTLTDGVIDDLLARRKELEPRQKAFLEKVLKLQQEIAQDAGADVESLRGAAEGQMRVAALQHRLSRLPEAEQAYRAALDLNDRLQRMEPGEPISLARQASAWNYLGNVLREAGRPKEAGAALRHALQLMGQTGGLDRLKTQMNLALLLELGDDLPGAVAGYREVLKGLADMEAAPVASEEARALAAQCRSNLGSALNSQGQDREAAEHLGKAIAMFRLLCREFLGRPEYRSGLAKALHNLGSAREGLGNFAEAEKLFGEAAEVEKKLVHDYEGVPEYRADLGRHLDKQATRLRLSGKRKGAESLYREAVIAAAQAAKERPRSAELREQEAGMRENLATLLAEDGRFAEAEPAMRLALAAWRALAKDMPTNPRFALYAAGRRGNLIRMLLDQDKHKEALVEANETIQMLEEIATRPPGVPGTPRYLGLALLLRAMASIRLQRFADALTDCERGLKLGQGFLEPELKFHQANCLAHLDRAPEAAAGLDRLAGQGGIPDEFAFLAAGIYARASAAAKGDAAGTEKYARRALAQLRQAQQAGHFKDPAGKQQLLRETDLDLLRDRADFKNLVAEVGKP